MGLFIGNLKDEYLPKVIRSAMGKDTKKWGIKFDGTNSAGVRTYDAADMRWSVSSNTVKGRDDFAEASDIFKPKLCLTKYDSSQDKRVVMAYEGDSDWDSAVASGEGDYMREFVPFYYQRPNAWEFIVSDGMSPGFTVDPMHYHKGTLYPKVRVTAYNLGPEYVSKPGVATLTNTDMNTFRENLRAKGMYLMDYPTYCCIGWLGIVKTGNLDTQATVGYGFSNSSAAATSGATDNVQGLDGSATGLSTNEPVKFMGIENLYANVWKYVDGFYLGMAGLYIKDVLDMEKDPTSCNDLTGYTKIMDRFSGTYDSGSCIRDLEYDAKLYWSLFPRSFVNDMRLGPIHDIAYLTYLGNEDMEFVCVGGCMANGEKAGLFAFNSNIKTGSNGSVFGAIGIEFATE